jgi:hypothetical protein
MSGAKKNAPKKSAACVRFTMQTPRDYSRLDGRDKRERQLDAIALFGRSERAVAAFAKKIRSRRLLRGERQGLHGSPVSQSM